MVRRTEMAALHRWLYRCVLVVLVLTVLLGVLLYFFWAS